MINLELAARVVIHAYGRLPHLFASDEQIIFAARALVAGDGGAAFADKPGVVAAAEALIQPEPATAAELEEIRGIALSKVKAGDPLL
jgi:hypothetical protein